MKCLFPVFGNAMTVQKAPAQLNYRRMIPVICGI